MRNHFVHSVENRVGQVPQQQPEKSANARHSSLETRSLPARARSYPRRFAFYVAFPGRSIVTDHFSRSFYQKMNHEGGSLSSL
jgi:hypothetical protein